MSVYLLVANERPLVLVALLIALPLRAAALQANTPEAALEEIATADKPEIIARHLPEPVRKRIEELPHQARLQVLQKLLELKSSEFNGCTVRRVADSSAWEIVDQNGNTKGKVKLADTFISGLDAMLPRSSADPQARRCSLSPCIWKAMTGALPTLALGEKRSRTAPACSPAVRNGAERRGGKKRPGAGWAGRGKLCRATR